MSALSLETLVELDRRLRSGETDAVRAALIRLPAKRIARELAVKLASLARRAGLTGLSLEALYPFVRPTSRKATPASAEESAEYALALAAIGATEEALEIFSELDAERYPQLSFFAAMAHLTLWNYEAAVPLLRRYIPSPVLDEYRRLVGKLNLASALIALRNADEAAKVLADLDAVCSTGGFQLHLGNVLELHAQHAVLEKSWSEARRYLDLAEQDAQAFGGRDPLFIRKWRTFLPLLEKGATPEALAALEGFRGQALEAEQWESVRQCDRLRAVTSGDRELLLRLYAGTPSRAFRRFLARDVELGEIPTEYVLSFGKHSSRTKEIDLTTGEHPILRALASDFYRPVRMASLFALMHPEECYHPVKSPARVRRAISRFRAWAKERKIPLAIVEKDGAYRIEASGACRLRLAIENEFLRDRYAA